MFKVYDNQIILTRGDSGFFNVEILTQAGETAEIPDTAEVIFSVKKSTLDKDTLIKKTGTAITIEPSDTSSLDYGTYYYDVQVSYADGGVDTIITPTPFIIAEEVTF